MSNERFLELLTALVPINGLAPQHRRKIMKRAQFREYRQGRYVFRQGDRDSYAVYLLEGQLDLYADGNLVKTVMGGTDAARYALAQLQPRQLSAHARTPVTVMRVDRSLLDRLLSMGFQGTTTQELEVTELGPGEAGGWMGRMLHSELFKHMPAGNIQRIFTLMESFEAAAGDVIVRQDEPGDYYYVIQRGHCEVARRAAGVKHDVRLAELHEGDSFGEEALIADATRNATVRMLTDGELMRLTKEDFIELIKKPALKSVTYKQAREMISAGAVGLDVRFPEERGKSGIPGALNVPLNLLRMEAARLDSGKRYCIYCDDGRRSAVGAFLLTARGFDASYIVGGLAKPVPKPAPAAKEAPPEAPPTRGRQDYRSARHQPDTTIDADIRASSLKAELAKANMRLEEALRLKAAAESARHEVEQTLSTKLHAERAELNARAAEADAALREAQRLKAEAKAAKMATEASAFAKDQAEAKRTLRLREETERRLREQQGRQQDASARSDEEVARIARIKAEAEEGLKAERAALEAQAADVRRQLEDALKIRAEAEEVARSMQITSKTRLRAEQETLRAEAERVSQALEEAMRIKKDVEMAKRAAEEEASRRRQEEEENIRQLRREAERRLREEQAKLEGEYARNAEALAEIQRKKEQAEARLREQRKRLEAEAAEARRQMDEARRARMEMESTRRSVAEEERLHADELAREQKRREEVQHRLAEEKRRLEEAFARNAAELEQARGERAAAEAARRAAAEEAERIIAEYKVAYEQMRQQKEAELQAHRQRLQSEGQRIRDHLAEAQDARREAQAARLEAEREVARLRAELGVAKAESAAKQRLKAELQALEAGMSQADERVVAAEHAQAEALAAQEANETAFARQRQAEAHMRGQLEEEVQQWRQEQALLEKALESTGVLDEQRAYMERIKRRAEEAKRTSQQAETELLKDVATQLRNKG
jgi:CRP-like cAMP-binding protein